jgi:hypothetical protein
MEASQHSLLAACFTLHSINATLASLRINFILTCIFKMLNFLCFFFFFFFCFARVKILLILLPLKDYVNGLFRLLWIPNSRGLPGSVLPLGLYQRACFDTRPSSILFTCSSQSCPYLPVLSFIESTPNRVKIMYLNLFRFNKRRKQISVSIIQIALFLTLHSTFWLAVSVYKPCPSCISTTMAIRSKISAKFHD